MDGEGVIAVALRGGGAWIANLGRTNDDRSWQRMHVSDVNDVCTARVPWSLEIEYTNVSQIDNLGARLGIQDSPIRMDNQAKQVLLAAGKGDILLRLLSPGRDDYKEKIRNQAADTLLVEEAGGKVPDLAGKVLDFSSDSKLVKNIGVFASIGLLHDEVLEELKTWKRSKQ